MGFRGSITWRARWTVALVSLQSRNLKKMVLSVITADLISAWLFLLLQVRDEYSRKALASAFSEGVADRYLEARGKEFVRGMLAGAAKKAEQVRKLSVWAVCLGVV